MTGSVMYNIFKKIFTFLMENVQHIIDKGFQIFYKKNLFCMKRCPPGGMQYFKNEFHFLRIQSLGYDRDSSCWHTL